LRDQVTQAAPGKEVSHDRHASPLACGAQSRIWPDGVFAQDDENGDIRFHHLPTPSTDEIEELVVQVSSRVERWLARQGFGIDEPQDDGLDGDAQLTLQSASVAGRVALGMRRGPPDRDEDAAVSGPRRSPV